MVSSDGTRGSASAGLQDLLVWCDDAEAAAPLLAALRQRFAVDAQDSLAALGARLADAPGTRVLLLYLSPVETLCRAMAGNTPPSAALAEWQARAPEILDLNRRDRRRVRLLEIGMGRANPEVFRQHFQLPEAELPKLPSQDEILMLMAHRVLSGDPQARCIQGELEAASLDCTGGTARGAEDPDAAFRAYRDMRLAHRRERQEAELLDAQTRVAREEMKALAARKVELEGALEAAEKGRRQAQRDTELLQERSRAAQEEMQALTARKLKLEDSLEAAKKDGRRAGKEAELLQAQVRMMKQEMEALTVERQQLEQRLAQMRQGMESYRAQLSGLSVERDSLTRRVDEKERSLAAAGTALRDVEAQMGDLTARLDRMRADRDDRQREIDAKDAEIRQLVTSKSFRLTAPLRRLRLLISGGGTM